MISLVRKIESPHVARHKNCKPSQSELGRASKGDYRMLESCLV